jgi:hypothetical protein
MALTLLEAAKLNSGDDVRSAVISLFAASDDLLMVLPYEPIEGNALKYNQEEALPGIAFRGVNGSYTESTGVLNPIVEQLVIAGGDLDVDLFLTQTMGQGQRATQEAMKVKALAHTIGHKIIKGDSATSPLEFDGLQTRLTGSQVLSSAVSGGVVLSLDSLDELIDTVDNPTHLLMSKAVKRSLTSAARNTSVGGFITTSIDAFGRPISMYGDLPILIADKNSNVNATLGFNEAYSGGGGSTGTSIYCMSLGEGSMTGIQNGQMRVTDLGELEAKPSTRTRVEWFAGLAMWSPRAAGRLRDIKAGAVTA